jgi:hypothetical protein
MTRRTQARLRPWRNYSTTRHRSAGGGSSRPTRSLVPREIPTRRRRASIGGVRVGSLVLASHEGAKSSDESLLKCGLPFGIVQVSDIAVVL